MKKRKAILYIFIIVVIFIMILSLVLQKVKKSSETLISLTNEEKIQDFEYLWAMLEESYPFWNEVADSGIDKNAVYENYKKEIYKTSTDIEFMKTVGYFIKEFKGYGHLSVLDGYMYNLYNEVFTLGKTALKDEEIKRMEPWYSVLYNTKSRQTYSQLDSSHAGFRSIKGLKDEYLTKNVSNATKQEAHKQNLIFNIIDKDRIAYLKINSFNFQYIENDRTQLQKFFEEVSSYPNLIIDIQDNNGGSDKYWQDLIVSQNLSEPKESKRYFLIKKSDINLPFLKACFSEENILPIKDLPEFDKLQKDAISVFSDYITDNKVVYPSKNEHKFKGKIWVLTSPKVYSSSENFVVFCKNSGFATLVGRQTGGDGGVADPILISLPNSGFIIRFSMFYGLNDDGTGNEATGTLPHIVAKENENVVDLCISQISK